MRNFIVDFYLSKPKNCMSLLNVKEKKFKYKTITIVGLWQRNML